MKILQVITSMRIGGAEHLVSQIAPAMKRRGHQCDVALFCGEDSAFKQSLREQGVTVFDLSMSDNYYSPDKIAKLRRLMRGYDVVHTHNTAPQLFAAMAGLGRKCRLVTTEHNTCNRRRNKPWLKLGDRWMYGRYDRVVCISDQAEHNLRAYLHSESRRISTIYNGVDVEAFHGARPLDELHHEGRFAVVMVAGFRYQKDQDTLLRAIALLPESYELWLVGDGERRGELTALVEQLGISPRVCFMGIRSDVARLLKSADVVVMSSHFEGLSLSNVEGMSAGRPFVASDVDGLREVTSGYGLLFPHGDAQALATTIRRLHDDRELYAATAARCYQRARQYDLSRMMDGYEKLYEELSKERR